MSKNKDIAVVGMAFRFPGGIRNEEQFWSLVNSGTCAITKIPASRWPTDLYQDDNKNVPGRSVTFNAGVLDSIKEFEPAFFGISPKEAEWMDPQQRLLLKVTHECLENANIKISDFKGSDCGVYAGVSSLDYFLRADEDLPAVSPYTMTGNTLSIDANRISYVFDLHGPSVTMDTACSSTLVTLHHACQAIRSGEIPCAIVAGAHLLLRPYSFVGFSKASMLSPTGTCRPFDERANGYVRSEGAAALLLKPLEDAIRDHNRIHAVIKASGVNTDGSRKSGLTIPSETAQSQLMKQVLERSGISVDDVDYIEAHGTGTPVGDPIEVRSISSVYARDRNGRLPVSSVKANLGHMEPMSGLAGIVKAITVLKHGTVPPIPFDFRPSPKIDFDGLNILCSQDGVKLSDKRIHTGAVNSFGFGGANAHVILQSFDNDAVSENADTEKNGSVPPLFISAKTKDSLKEIGESYADLLRSGKYDYYDVAYTAVYGRDTYEHRLAVTGAGQDEVLSSLDNWLKTGTDVNVFSALTKKPCRKVAFVFNGNGSQYVGMGRSIYRECPLFASVFDDLSERIEKYLNVSLKDIVSGKTAEEGSVNEADLIQDTKIAQTLIFAIQVAVSAVLEKGGLKPEAVVGHSMGEIAAAYVAGLLTVDEAVKVICIRSMLQDRTRGHGKMAAVSVSENDFNAVRAELGITDVDVAAINSSDNITISGRAETIYALKEYYSSRNVFFKVLDVDYPFHSSFMNVIENDVMTDLSDVGTVSKASCGTAFYSAVLGRRIEDGFSLKNNYWWHNIRDKVQFWQAVKAMTEDGFDYIVEIGSNAILQRYLRDISKKSGADARVGSTLLVNNDGVRRIRQVVMDYHLSADASDKGIFFPEAGRLVELPYYRWSEKVFEYKESSEKHPDEFRIFPLLGWNILSADRTWQNVLEPSKYALLRDHVVDGEYVYAAADFIETVLEGASCVNSGECINIEHLDILSSLVFDGEHYKSMRLRIVPETMSFDIYSRDYLSFDEWTRNVKGRLLTTDDAALRNAVNLYEAKKNDGANGVSPVVVTRDEIYAITESLGLHYGEQFALTERVEILNDVLKIHLDGNALKAHSEKYIIHPGILDAGFHSLFAMKQLSSADSAYLPVKFGRISVMKNAEVSYIVARIERIGARSILASFRLFNDADECVGIMDNCRFNMMPKTENRSAEEGVASWHYEAEAAPHALSACRGDVRSASEIVSFLKARANDLSDLNTQDRKNWYERIMPLMEQAVLAYSAEAVKAVASDAGALASAGTRPLYGYLTDLLIKHNLVKVVDGVPVDFVSQDDIGTGDEIIRYAYHLAPEALPDLLPVYRVGNRLKDLLVTGQASDGVSAEDLRGEERNGYSLLYTGMKAAMSSFIADVSQRTGADEGAKFRVLEIGSNRLKLGELLADCFAEGSCVEVLALNEKDMAEVIPSENVRKVRFDPETFTVERDAADPYIPQKYDLIVVQEALYRASSVIEAVEGLKNMLASGGVIAVLERHSDWSANMCSGFGSDWWSERGDGNAISPLRSPEYWKTVFEKSFNDVSVYREPAASEYRMGAYLMFVRNSDEISLSDVAGGVKHAYAVISPEGNSVQAGFIRNELAGLGVKADVIAAGEDSLDSLNIADYDSFVFVSSCGLASHQLLNSLSEKTGMTATSGDSTDISDALSVLTSVANKLNGYAQKNAGAGEINLSVVTVNGSSVRNQMLTHETVPEQSALIGLSRVIRSEASEINVRSIDLSFKAETDTGAAEASLLKDLLLPDGSDEVILSGAERFRTVVRSYERENDPADASNNVGKSDGSNSLISENYCLDFTSPGRLRNLCWKKKTVSAPKANEVIVNVKVTGLNFRDIMLTMGLVPDDALENGFSGPALGLEFAGVVSEVGSDVTEYVKGDRVLGFGSACFTDKLTVPEYAIARIPDEWSFDAAATAPIVFFTAWYAIHHLSRMEEGESILIHGAAGGVGIAAIQIARHLGLKVYATAGSPEKRDFLKMLGVEHIYNSRNLDFHDEVMRDTGGVGVNAVLNCLSGEAMRVSMTVLQPFGRFMELGKRDFVENTTVGLRSLKENISYFAIDVDQLFKVYPKRARELFHEVIGLFAEGEFTPLPFTKFCDRDVVKAFKFMQQGGQIGKITVERTEHSATAGTEAERGVSENSGSREVFRADDVWMITGGTGGFGFATARYLIGQGIKKLVLVSRSGIRDESVLAELEDLIAANCLSVIVEKCDVSKAEEVRALRERLDAAGITVNGIIHAAAVFADTMLQAMNRELYAGVMNPKFVGACNLHEVFNSEALRNFVVYSSISVAIGNIGQANYVSANSGLEGLTAMRQAQGLPSCCIEWGPISDTGYLSSRTQIKKSLESVLGAEALTCDEALALLPQALRRGGVNIFANLNWAGVAETSGRISSRIYDLVQKDKLRLKDFGSDDLLSVIEGRSREEAIAVISDMLVSEIADTMGLSSDQIAKDQNLQSIGLDSLMAMELIVSIEKKTKIKLSVMAFQDNPTVLKLAEKIFMKISGNESSDGEDQGTVRQVISAHVDESERDVIGRQLDMGK